MLSQIAVDLCEKECSNETSLMTKYNQNALDQSESVIVQTNENILRNEESTHSCEDNIKTTVNDCVYKTKWRKSVIVDSDSDESSTNDGVNLTEFEPSTELISRKKHKKMLVESDSEEEPDTVTVHKSFSDDVLNREQPVFTTNFTGELIPENVELDKKIAGASRLYSLCDPESSEDEVVQEKNEEICPDEKIISKQYKKKSNSREDSKEKPKKMTGKEAAELRKEIKSESQRMLREKNISLPYHKPKSYTLKEFLSMRPKFSSAVPSNVRARPSVAIKMSAEQLGVISKKLKDREKEVEQFFKSESESEDDNEDKDYTLSLDKNCECAVEETGDVSNALDETKERQTYAIGLDTDNTLGSENILSETDLVVTNVENCDIIKESEASDMLIDSAVDKEADHIVHNLDQEILINTNNLDTQGPLHQDLDFSKNEVQNTEEKAIIEPEAKVETKEQQSSVDYEFNLDDIEENSETLTEKENPGFRKNIFEYTELDKEIENFGVNNTTEETNSPTTVPSKPLTKLELIKEQLSNIKPKLTGSPNDVIDLETGIAKPNEVTKLMERFVKHNLKKPVHKNKVKLSIVSIESGEIHKETVAMNLDDDNETTIEEKPGARLQKLRDELQHQMAQKRSELWQKKSVEDVCKETKSIDEEQKEKPGEEDDILDDEEEELEMTESSEEDEDFDICEAKEKKPRSVFISEEAEESDKEEDGDNETTVEDEDTNEGDDDDDETNNFFEETSEVNEDNDEHEVEVHETETQCAKKSYKKILRGFTEDSDDEDFDSLSQFADVKINNENTKDTLSQQEYDIFPPHQPQSSQTPIKQITQNKSEFEFLTPISYITGLQNLNNSVSKDLNNSPVKSPFSNLNEISPLKINDSQESICYNHFEDTITDSQAEKICSGTFPETQNNEEPDLADKENHTNLSVQEKSSSNDVSNEKLLELSSDKFSSTQEVEKRGFTSDTPSSQELLNICSGKFTGITQLETSNKIIPETYTFNTSKEVKSLDDDQDLIISQLIDEEEMEKFKKKFESPVISNTQRRIVEEFEEAMTGGGVIDSDDETDTVGVKKKNKKRLMFSDDDDSDKEEYEEVIDLHDDIEEDEDSNVAVDDIAYDSEENEIEVDNGADSALKLSEFFENEAELSESEWGSADEDEKDLDTMEFEQGDTEKYDEKKIRTDLEKIHMRRMLDDDTREVKLLQEMLLEDGELHGSGRERQFKWKNIDSVTEADEAKEDDEIYLEEEESEEQWRKRRHEREMFLQEKLKKSQQEDNDLLNESQLLKIGQKVIQKSQSNSQSNISDKISVTSGSPVLKQFSLLNKRGSFLSRSDQVLQRVAEYNKVSSVTIGTVKNSRNFIFQAVSTEETLVSDSENKKRKFIDGTPNGIKKLRLSENLSPALKKKKPGAKAKLFNW